MKNQEAINDRQSSVNKRQSLLNNEQVEINSKTLFSFTSKEIVATIMLLAGIFGFLFNINSKIDVLVASQEKIISKYESVQARLGLDEIKIAAMEAKLKIQ